jgi:DNA (cytosine-5)-methyltransferase 1
MRNTRSAPTPRRCRHLGALGPDDLREELSPYKNRPPRRTAEPLIASLFSGCGGLDKGFETMGFQPIGAYDIDPRAVEVYNTNLKPVARVLDLSLRDPAMERPDVLLAGSPCQGFSTSGKRLVADPRNDLLSRAGSVAVALLPRVFVLENVPAALSGRHRTRWRLVEDMLRWNGYNVRRFLADGQESGLAQLRRRLFLVAWLGSDCIRIEPPPVRPVSLTHALAEVEGVPDHDPIPLQATSKNGKVAARIAPGRKLSNVRAGPSSVHTLHVPEVYGAVGRRETEVLDTVLLLRRRDRRRRFGDADPVLPSTIDRYLGRDCSADIGALLEGYLRRIAFYVDLTHTYNGKFHRLSWNRPSPTVDTHFGDPALFLHPDENRGFTPREAARIQGFGDSFRFGGTRRSRFRMIGNAVPPPMAARLAAFVRSALI